MNPTRTQLLHYARATLQQARHFRLRGERHFSTVLLGWAGKARRQAASAASGDRADQQPDLFA